MARCYGARWDCQTPGFGIDPFTDRVAALIAWPPQTRHCERSEAIQAAHRQLDCFVAEPVIGPATSGRTRWLLAMPQATR